jgi:TonB family protein
MARDFKFIADLMNQSDRRVTEFLVEIRNPSFWANEPVNIISKPSGSPDAPDKQRVVGPQESFRFENQLPLREKKGDLNLMNHIYDFKIRVIGVKFESDDYWLMAQPGKTPGTARVMMSFNLPENAVVREMKVTREMRKKDSTADQDQGAADSVQAMSRSLRPTILYREKAQYTQEAKDNKVEGTVVLSCVFGVDGQISDIKVIQGLPHGLTENAFIAAKKIRFEPAIKDGRPAPVRGNVEFTFNLYKDPIQEMNSSLRPTILYKERAAYTREAKDNKVEGTVVLSVVFGADAQIGDIRVIHGLPHGLTQKAIEAASKIRFEPAVKDGQPVSVRGKLEFSFRL